MFDCAKSSKADLLCVETFAVKGKGERKEGLAIGSEIRIFIPLDREGCGIELLGVFFVDALFGGHRENIIVR